MSKSENKQRKSSGFSQKAGPALRKTGKVISLIWSWIFRLRKLILAIPVVVAAAILAVRNSRQLPEEVSLIFFAGEGASQMIPRNIAVLGPVAITALCLLLMMCSRKTLYPWMISIFSLVLPIIIMLSGMFAI